jgi:hypothetical protein
MMRWASTALAGAIAAAAALAGLATAGPAAQDRDIALVKIGTVAAGPIADVFDNGAAEIPAYDRRSKRLFVVNGLDNVIDVYDLSNPAAPVEVEELDVSSFGSPNSVAVNGRVVAVASTAVDDAGDDVRGENGTVAFFATSGDPIGDPVEVGATPDMLVFTPNGDWLLVANEAEPEGYAPGQIDPEGSVSVFDMRRGVERATVRTAGFGRFNARKDALIAAGVRIFGPGATVAQDVEPEYIAVEHDSRTAWVTLQEANALAELDVRDAEIERIVPLGTKDHAAAGNGLDASDQDGVSIAQRAVRGMYQPDGIAALEHRGKTYLFTANEGDVREWDEIRPGTDAESLRLSSGQIVLDPSLPADLKSQIGRLNVSAVPGRPGGDTDGDGDRDQVMAFGARSFSVWQGSRLVWDSGDALEQLTSTTPGVVFNASNTNNTLDNRSDDKGPEPEEIELGKVSGRWYAFVGLERPGGVAVYDVSDPRKPELEQYVNNRDFAQAPDSGLAGDLGPEGIVFVEADDSPIRRPLVIVANEISGTITVYRVDRI